jgi:hypothetical protein
MKIVDIFKNKDYLVRIVDKARMGRATSDCNAIGGALCETELCKIFNKDNNKFKLLNAKMLETLYCPLTFNLSNFAKNLEELKKKTKNSFGNLSAADFFLFEKSKTKFRLLDVQSLKSSIPTTDEKTGGINLYLQNDANSEIYDAIKSGNFNNNVGSIISIVVREGTAMVYYFDGNLETFFKDVTIKTKIKDDKEIKIEFYHKEYRNGKVKFGEAINRNAITKKKHSSYNRGFRVVIPKNKYVDYFDVLNLLVRKGAFKKITSVKSEYSTIVEDIKKTYSL